MRLKAIGLRDLCGVITVIAFGAGVLARLASKLGPGTFIIPVFLAQPALLFLAVLIPLFAWVRACRRCGGETPGIPLSPVDRIIIRLFIYLLPTILFLAVLIVTEAII